MLTSTYKGVSMRNFGACTGVAIEEEVVPRDYGYARPPYGEPRVHDLGTFDRVTAEWIDSRLRQRFPESSEQLTESEVDFIKRQIAEGTL
jgi:hypothetical protein